MMTQMRYVFLALSVLISLHYILSFTNTDYGNATSISHLFSGNANPSIDPLGGYKPPTPPAAEDKPPATEDKPPAAEYKPPAAEYKPPMGEYHMDNNATTPSQAGRKANAAIVMLARNNDLNGIVTSMKQMEDRFNKKFNYPYVFLNEEPFSEDFKTRVSGLTDSQVQFGLIPHDHWFQPDSIDETRAAASRLEMVNNNVIYGGSVPYRNMCRYNSGFFYRHELLKPFKYYWRVEPSVTYFCDLDYDPFLVMQDQNKVYGFTLSLPEYPATIPTLWNAVKEFINAHPGLVSPENAMDFLSDDGGETYNRCHFWSNFEIGDLDLWRGEAYSKFFDFLDEKGGFYYERWGDAPVHSIGAALFAKKDQIHFFNDIGYRHEPFQHCPQGAAHAKGKCWCDPKNNFDHDWYSCLKKYEALFKS
ncbi:glycosyltransferase family 15 protein [Mycena vulgaris]|nr:glycosyltransferase family 15 protein [Mycena vulgaris]